MANSAKFVVDRKGQKVSVILDIAEYERMLERLEELDDIRAYDAAKASKDEVVPFREAMARIRRGRKK